jgi:hypothetical protein
MAENNNSEPKEKPPFRDWLAVIISVVSISGIIILSVAIFRNLSTDSEKIMTIFTSVLALAGSWIGTILAFYFSKENFESATRNVAALVNQVSPQERLKSLLAKDKMTPKDKIIFVKLPAEQINLTETLNNLELSKRGSRLPVLTEMEHPAYIVHKSSIIEFLFERSQSISSPPSNESIVTLRDFLDDPEMKKRAENFAVLREDGTLADAKSAMDNKPGCQDVFITKGGTKDEPLTGWITNNTIAESAVV